MKVVIDPDPHSAGNPYLQMYSEGLAGAGCDVLGLECRPKWRDIDVLNIHFPDLATGSRSLLRSALWTTILHLRIASARRAGTRVVWTAHNVQSHDQHHPRLERWSMRRVAESIDGFAVLSDDQVAAFEAVYPTLHDLPRATIPHGDFRGWHEQVPTRHQARTRLGLGRDLQVFLSLGDLRAYKDTPNVVACFRRMEGSDLRLLIAGRERDAGVSSAVRAAAAEDPRIILHLGWLSDDEVADHVAASDVVCVPYGTVLNSSVAMLGLSLGRRVLMPNVPSAERLRTEVGAEWVTIAEHSALTQRDLEASVRDLPPSGAVPPLSGRDWAAIGEAAAAFFRSLPSPDALPTSATSCSTAVRRRSWTPAPASASGTAPRWAYVTLQRRGAGDAGDTHVDNVVSGLRRAGQHVELFSLRGTGGLLRRGMLAAHAQARLLRSLGSFEFVYVRMHPLAALTVASCRARRTPVIVEVNGVAEDYVVAHPELHRLRRPLRWLLRRQLRDASAITAVTAGLTRWVAETAGARNHVEVVANAADPNTFRPGLPRPDDAPTHYALFIGSLSSWQGLELCLRAATESTWPRDVELLIIGDGVMAPAVRCAQAAAPGRVRWLGRREPEQIPYYLANAVLTLALKQYHSPPAGQSPLKVYESMSSAVPVVGTTMHGMELVQERKAGVLLDNPTPAAVAQTVNALATDAVARAGMGDRGRRAIVTANTWDHRVEQILGVASLCGRR